MTLVRWQDVALWDDESDEPIVNEIRIEKLREYRATRAIAGAWLVDPAGRASPEDRDAMSHEGPTVDEIDWTGFPAAEGWNAYAYPSQEEIDRGGREWDMVHVGSAQTWMAAADLLPKNEHGQHAGQVQEGVGGEVRNLP